MEVIADFQEAYTDRAMVQALRAFLLGGHPSRTCLSKVPKAVTRQCHANADRAYGRNSTVPPLALRAKTLQTLDAIQFKETKQSREPSILLTTKLTHSIRVNDEKVGRTAPDARCNSNVGNQPYSAEDGAIAT